MFDKDKYYTIYEEARKKKNISREQASEMIGDLSVDQLGRIERGEIQNLTPEYVEKLAEGYEAPYLRNYYCSYECEIGKKKGENLPVKTKSISQIAIETYNATKRIEKYKERMLEIVEDEAVSVDEIDDFKEIEANLEKMANIIENFRLWIANERCKGSLKADR